MNDAERYATERIAELTKALAGYLKPTTLQSLIDDIDFYGLTPLPEDLATFGAHMARQLDVLT